MPNVFTPNNDGENDFFEPILFNQIFSPHFIILNRWGNVVYESYDLFPSWNGKVHGKESLDGVYFWILESKNNNMIPLSNHGFFHLLR
jgi:gliding motility-associated-like protein